jgi:dimethylaniline monooxygenase (N-oxide forming) / hypotaurine monooxygenase
MVIFRHLVLDEYKRMGFTHGQIASALSLPKFDVWSARLTPGTQVLKQILSGAIRIRPEIARVETEGVRFVDDTFAPADTIIGCTGYALRFPFLDASLAKVEGDTVELYKHVFHPSQPNLAFVGMCIVNGPLFPVAEMQARWAARVFAGVAALPPSSARIQAVERQRRMHRRLEAHLMRVQLADYMDELALQIHARPRLFLHPRLIRPLLLGPLVAAQYRLDGIGKSDRAKAIIAAK